MIIRKEGTNVSLNREVKDLARMARLDRSLGAILEWALLEILPDQEKVDGVIHKMAERDSWEPEYLMTLTVIKERLKVPEKGNKEKVPEPPKVDIAALVDSAVEAYIQDHEKEVADGFYILPKKVKEILRKEYQKLSKAKQKSFDTRIMAELLVKVKLEDTLEEVPK